MSIHSVEDIKKIIAQADVDSFEIIPLYKPLSFAQYQEWLSKGMQGEMDYMAKNQDVRENPHQNFTPMQSLIMVTQSYFPHPEPVEKQLASLKIAHYARNKDYHHWFRKKLNAMILKLKGAYPSEEFLSFTDAVPLLERDHAAQAALGWIGKNTMLIHPSRGSFFFIGEILTTLSCNTSHLPMHDFCGSCTACIEACPTDALNGQRQLDANLCLAHWNIESREIPPLEIREKMGGWFFGCDICQNVCPWNIKLHKNTPAYNQQSGSEDDLIQDLRWVLTQSNKKILKEVGDSPLSRAGGRGLKRNALIVIGNLKLHTLKNEVQSFLNHERLAPLAQWTLEKLSGS